MPFPIGTQNPPKKKKNKTSFNVLSRSLATRLCSWWIGGEIEKLGEKSKKKKKM